MADLTPEQQALIMAGVVADYALTLVGGMGLNGPIEPVHPDQFSASAAKLRYAVESYNAHILLMRCHA
jgi:hypothetical protein